MTQQMEEVTTIQTEKEMMPSKRSTDNRCEQRGLPVWLRVRLSTGCMIIMRDNSDSKGDLNKPIPSLYDPCLSSGNETMTATKLQVENKSSK